MESGGKSRPRRAEQRTGGRSRSVGKQADVRDERAREDTEVHRRNTSKQGKRTWEGKTGAEEKKGGTWQRGERPGQRAD